MNYTIAESYTLPSKGLIYDVPVNPEIKLRSMTTLEEMKRLSKSDRQYQHMSEIIDDCLVEKPGISAYDMFVGDYQFLLHKLRVVTYGPEYHVASTCPACGNLNDGVVNLDEIPVLEYSDEIKDFTKVTLPKSGKVIELKFQTPRMLDNIAVQAKEMNRKSRSSVDYSYIVTLQNFIKTVDGEKLDPLKMEDFVRAMDMQDANTLMQYSKRLAESLGLNTELLNECENCGLTYKNNFRITSEFFGPRINF